jgi:hypothetical protein
MLVRQFFIYFVCGWKPLNIDQKWRIRARCQNLTWDSQKLLFTNNPASSPSRLPTAYTQGQREQIGTTNFGGLPHIFQDSWLLLANQLKYRLVLRDECIYGMGRPLRLQPEDGRDKVYIQI